MTVVHSFRWNQRFRQAFSARSGYRRLKRKALVSDANGLRHRESLRFVLDHFAHPGPFSTGAPDGGQVVIVVR